MPGAPGFQTQQALCSCSYRNVLTLEAHLRPTTTPAAIADRPHHKVATFFVEVYHHFIRDKVKSGVFSVMYISTANQLADVNTKLLPYDTHSRLSGVVMGELAVDVPRSHVTATNVGYDPRDAERFVKPGRRVMAESVA